MLCLSASPNNSPNLKHTAKAVGRDFCVRTKHQIEANLCSKQSIPSVHHFPSNTVPSKTVYRVEQSLNIDPYSPAMSQALFTWVNQTDDRMPGEPPWVQADDYDEYDEEDDTENNEANDDAIWAPTTFSAPDPSNRDTGYFAGYGPGHNVFAPGSTELADLLTTELMAASNGDREWCTMAVSGLLTLTRVRARFLADGERSYRNLWAGAFEYRDFWGGAVGVIADGLADPHTRTQVVRDLNFLELIAEEDEEDEEREDDSEDDDEDEEMEDVEEVTEEDWVRRRLQRIALEEEQRRLFAESRGRFSA
ncbi:hypothetical protein V8F06_003996 [Rhypophila decipiens]